MHTPISVPQDGQPLRWHDDAQTPIYVDTAAMLLGRRDQQVPGRSRDLVLDGPHGTLHVEPTAAARSCWEVRIALHWPRHGDRELWTRLLLAANAQLSRHAPVAFAIDTAHRPILLGRLYAGPEHEHGIARDLREILDVCASIEQLARIEAPTALACDALTDYIALSSPDARDGAPPELVDILVDIGLPARQACQIAATGVVQMDGLDVRVATAAGGRALRLAVHAGHAVLDGLGTSALRVGETMMRDHGISIGQDHTGHWLVCHWPWQGRTGQAFERCLSTLGGVADLLASERTVREPVDFDRLDPYAD